MGWLVCSLVSMSKATCLSKHHHDHHFHFLVDGIGGPIYKYSDVKQTLYESHTGNLQPIILHFIDLFVLFVQEQVICRVQCNLSRHNHERAATSWLVCHVSWKLITLSSNGCLTKHIG